MEADDSQFADSSWLEAAHGRFLIYFGPHLQQDLDRAAVRCYLKKRHAYGALWAYAWDCGSEGTWSSIICDIPDYDASKIENRKGRQAVRRCLRTCQVRVVDPAWLIEHGYETYRKAVARYADVPISGYDKYCREMSELLGRPESRAYGVFRGQRLICYGAVLFCGRGVRVSMSRFDPAFSADRPMAGLYYTIAHDCLKDGAVDFVDNGWRPLLHKTNIWAFLAQLGWRVVHCRLGMELRRPLGEGLWLLRGVGRLRRSVLPSACAARVEALLLAQDVARSSEWGCR